MYDLPTLPPSEALISAVIAKPDPVLQRFLAEMKQQWGNYEASAARATFASSAMKLALACVGEGPEDSAGVLVHGLTKVHSDGE